MPTRFALIFAVAMVAVATAGPSAADTTASGAHRTPMHPSTLTLRGHGRAGAGGHHRTHNHVHATFNQPTHIHGTMAGPRM